MATKTITIMDDAYIMLLKSKLKNESFSDVIRRVFGKKRSIMEFAGAWKDMDKSEINKMKEGIEEYDIKETKKLLKKYRR
jgi:predicted CopG family antitoxin